MLSLRMVLLSVAAVLISLTPVRAGNVHDSFQIPSGWVQTYEDVTADYRLVEYVPDGEDYKNWSEMITLIQFDVTGKEASEDILDRAMSGIARRCKKKALAVGDHWIRGEKKRGMIASIACDDIDTRGAPPGVVAFRKELLRVVVSDTKDGIVMLQYVWHDQDESAQDQFRSTENWDRFRKLADNLQLNF